MSALRELLEAEAAVTRRAVPVRARRHVHLSDDARLLIVYQLAANDFSVVGVAFGRPGAAPDHVIACPDPLDRADLAARLEPVRDDMAAWLASHTVQQTRGRNGFTNFAAAAAPQLVVAGAGVVTAIDNLAYGWRFTPGLDPAWAALGEELWVLADQRHRPGQASMLTLAEALADHYAFGISNLEAAKLAVGVAFCEAGPAGLSEAAWRDADTTESGPLAHPDDLDEPVWAYMKAGRRRPHPVVTPILRDTWERANRAWAHLAAIPEALSATAAAARTANAWAARIGPIRTNSTFRRRRALPSLSSAASELARLEAELARLSAEAALDDPMLAADRAADGKAARAELAFTLTTAGRTTTVEADVSFDQPLPLPEGCLVGIAGTSVRARLQGVRPAPGGGWQAELLVAGRDRDTTGIRAAAALANGTYWIVVVPKPGPPGLGAPTNSPITHPHARGRARVAAP